MAQSAENDAPEFEWGVQWSDYTLAYPDEEIARHECAYPYRPDAVNPVLVRRRVGEWERVIPPVVSEGDA